MLENHEYIRAPKSLPAFPDAVKVKEKTSVSGGGGLRARWKDRRAIYEWDSRHGYVEKYSRTTGKHLGEFDPNTGEQTKKADSSRKVEK